MTQRAPVHRPSPNDARNAWLLIGGLAITAVLIGSMTSRPDASSRPERMVDTNMSASIAAQNPPPAPAALDQSSIRSGVAHLRIAFEAEGFSGAMIYSQNCYDALGRQFSWTQLDRCGAFDVLAARSIETAEPGDLATETDYFQSEAVAGRYLAAATGAGQEPSAADNRLANLQDRVGGQRMVGVATTAEASNAIPADASINALESNNGENAVDAVQPADAEIVD